tara:strand:- start:295 stop:498 length:204 start_codon:yes stop_codon:yes gene_type:complete
MKSEKSSLENIGYIKELPKGSDIKDYEEIIIKNKKGEKITMYRLTEQDTEEDISNFEDSWRVFKSYL